MGDENYVKDAEHGLRRCVTDADYAAWARRFGIALVEQAYATARRA